LPSAANGWEAPRLIDLDLGRKCYFRRFTSSRMCRWLEGSSSSACLVFYRSSSLR